MFLYATILVSLHSQLILNFHFFHIYILSSVQFSSVTQSCVTLCDPIDCSTPGPSPIPRACSNSCPSGWWCHPTISPSVIPFSSRLQSVPASGSFPVSQFFTWGGQSRVSASESVIPMNIQDSFPLGLTGLISLQSNRLSRVFSTPQTKCKPTTSELCS